VAVTHDWLVKLTRAVVALIRDTVGSRIRGTVGPSAVELVDEVVVELDGEDVVVLACDEVLLGPDVVVRLVVDGVLVEDGSDVVASDVVVISVVVVLDSSVVPVLVLVLDAAVTAGVSRLDVLVRWVAGGSARIGATLVGSGP
jgi:hypothetical protein